MQPQFTLRNPRAMPFPLLETNGWMPDDVEEMSQKIVESRLVRKLVMPNPHLYCQAPGGQCLRLVGIDEVLPFHEGTGVGPDVAKEAIKKGGHQEGE